MQLCLLRDENKVLVGKLQQAKDSSKDDLDTATCAKECIGDQTEFSASSFEVGDHFSFLESAVP